VEQFHGTQGYWWQPSQRLLRLAKIGGNFAEN